MSASVHRRTGRCAPAFTLLEVMVAIAILSTALVILLQNVSSSIYLSEISRDMTVAAMIAQDKMTELELEGSIARGTQEGDFEDKYPGFWWSTTVEENELLAQFIDLDLYQLDLTIYWGNPDAPRTLTLANFVDSSKVTESTTGDESSGDDDDDETTGTE